MHHHVDACTNHRGWYLQKQILSKGRDKMKLKHIPNALCIIRFILVALLIPLSFVSENISILMLTLFLIAGFTDMIDGTIARKIKGATSNLGAELDSMADMFMVVVAVFFIVPHMQIWRYFQLAIIIALVFKLMSAVPGIIKHRKVFFLHTLSNKVLGFILFITVPIYFIFGGALGVNIYIIFIIVAVFAITLEEMVIIGTLDYPRKDIKGFWQVKKVNEEYRKNSVRGI